MWNWLLGREERKNHRQRFEVERDRRRLGELDVKVDKARKRERHLVSELKRLERELARNGR